MLIVPLALSGSQDVSSHLLKCSILADHPFGTFWLSGRVSSHLLKCSIHADRLFGTLGSVSSHLLSCWIHADCPLALSASQDVRLPTS